MQAGQTRSSCRTDSLRSAFVGIDGIIGGEAKQEGRGPLRRRYLAGPLLDSETVAKILIAGINYRPETTGIAPYTGDMAGHSQPARAFHRAARFLKRAHANRSVEWRPGSIGR